LIYFVYFVEKTLKKISTKHTKEESKTQKKCEKVIVSTFQTASFYFVLLIANEDVLFC